MTASASGWLWAWAWGTVCLVLSSCSQPAQAWHFVFGNTSEWHTGSLRLAWMSSHSGWVAGLSSQPLRLATVAAASGLSGRGSGGQGLTRRGAGGTGAAARVPVGRLCSGSLRLQAALTVRVRLGAESDSEARSTWSWALPGWYRAAALAPAPGPGARATQAGSDHRRIAGARGGGRGPEAARPCRCQPASDRKAATAVASDSGSRRVGLTWHPSHPGRRQSESITSASGLSIELSLAESVHWHRCRSLSVMIFKVYLNLN